MKAVNRILRYLKMTPDRGILYKKSDNRNVEFFLDVN
jgi:hypothetical protein